MSQDRTEKPTGKKIRDARKKGQIARSRDLALAATSVAVTIALGRLGGRIVEGLGHRMASDLSHVGDAPIRKVTEGDLIGLVFTGGTLIAMLVGPIALCTMVVGIAANGFQGGWIFSTERLAVNFGSLSPITGFKRLAPMKGGIDTLKTLIIASAITWIAWYTLKGLMIDSARMPWMTTPAAALLGWGYAKSLMWNVAWALFAVGIADYGMQRFRLMQSLRMTKQEVKDEMKQQENPETRGRVRRVQREMFRRRMMSDVKRATVVITNPTHFAVALEYRRGSMAAPMVLAKGRNLLALAIRERARRHGVPIVENRPLAQSLYKAAEVGETIPVELFAAVAEVLAQLIRLRQLTV